MNASLNSNPLELKGGILGMDILPDDAPAPRLCHLIKWPDFDGYGFNLHAERSNPGQFIGKIDEESPAQMAGLHEGDRIVEVNGVNISNENHRQVVERIKSNPNETKLLVVDVETDHWYKEQDLVLKSSQLNVIYIKTPVPRPSADSPRAKFHNSTINSNNNSQQQQQSSPLASSQQAQQTLSLSPSTNGSSLEATSDFNEDSIEHQLSPGQQAPEQGAGEQAQKTAASAVMAQLSEHQQKGAKASSVRSSPPMSPDSGKGDEELLAATASGAGHSVTIEAEINRQSPVKSPLLSEQQLEVNKQHQQQQEVIKSVLVADQVPQVSAELAAEPCDGVDNIQPDSLGEPDAPAAIIEMASSMSPAKKPTVAAKQDELAREAIISTKPSQANPSQECLQKNLNGTTTSNGNGSADSGKSSSPEMNSNCGTSMASDSLEEQHHHRHQQQQLPPPPPPEPKLNHHHRELTDNNNLSNSNLSSDDLHTIKGYMDSKTQSPVANKTATVNNSTNNTNETAKTTTPTEIEAVSGGQRQQLATPAAEQPLKSSLTNSNNNSEALQNKQPVDDEAMWQQQQGQQKKSPAVNTTANNFSGLNLNMTASEMRELIARRKKFDPKKAQMNIRQKYEIIQQM